MVGAQLEAHKAASGDLTSEPMKCLLTNNEQSGEIAVGIFGFALLVIS